MSGRRRGGRRDSERFGTATKFNAGGEHMGNAWAIASARRRLVRLVLLTLVAVAPWARAQQKSETDQQIRQKIIRESIAQYRGSCPCPYNVDRAGRSCGRRSAYSRPGGQQPLCYEKDVTDEMVRR